MHKRFWKSGIVSLICACAWTDPGGAGAGEIVRGNPLGGDAVDVFRQGVWKEFDGVGGLEFLVKGEALELRVRGDIGDSPSLGQTRRKVLGLVASRLVKEWSGASVSIEYVEETGQGNTRALAYAIRDYLRDQVAIRCVTMECAGVARRIAPREVPSRPGEKSRGDWVGIVVGWQDREAHR